MEKESQRIRRSRSSRRRSGRTHGQFRKAVVVMMGGGPAVVYGNQALEALEQFLLEQHEDAEVPAL